jgi:uncharacterized membrane protein
MSVLSQLKANKGVKWITLGWVGFIGENLILSHNRQDVMKTFGNDTYHMIYNFLSTAACGSIAYGYFKYGKIVGPAISPRGKAVHMAGFLLHSLGLVGMSQIAPAFQIPVGINDIPSAADPPVPQNINAELNNSTSAAASASITSRLYVRCPMDFRHKSLRDDEIFGMDRVSRHAMLWSMGIAALGSAVTSTLAPHVALFTFPIVFAGLGSEHQDYRYRRGNGGYLSKEREEVTSNVPFGALISGKQSWSALIAEMKWTNASLALLTSLILLLKRLR